VSPGRPPIDPRLQRQLVVLMFAALTLISIALAAKLGISIGRWALLVAPPAVALGASMNPVLRRLPSGLQRRVLRPFNSPYTKYVFGPIGVGAVPLFNLLPDRVSFVVLALGVGFGTETTVWAIRAFRAHPLEPA
jgi:hypothetical protein